MIGKKVREARLEMGISQKQLAAESSLTRPYISMVENGHTSPNKRTMEKLAFQLRKPVHFFYGESSVDSDVAAAAYLREAESLFVKRDMEKGLEWLDRIEHMRVGETIWVKAFLLRLDSWISMGKLHSAYQFSMERRSYLEKIVDRMLKYEVHMNLAKVFFRMERFKDAIEQYHQAIKLVSGLKSYNYAVSKAYTFLGTCNIRVGELEEALSAYLSAYELATIEGVQEQLGDIAMGIGKVYLLKKEFATSRTWIEKCIEFYSNHTNEAQAAALFNLAVVERKLGNISSFRDKLAYCTWFARKKDKELFSKCLIEIAIGHFILHQPESTLVYCQKALDSLSTTESTYLRGEIYRLLAAVYLHDKSDRRLAYFFSKASGDLFRRIPVAEEAAFCEVLLQKVREEIVEIL